MTQDRDSAGRVCGNNADFQIQLPYWSKIKFAASRTVSGAVFNYIIPAGTTVSAFSYGRNQSKGSAGFTAADGNAVDSDTNIAKGGETIAGESVQIDGISIMPMPAGTDGAAGATTPDLRIQDDRMLAALMSLCSCKIRLDTRGLLDLGPPIFLPGGGGLEGRAAKLSSWSGLAGDNYDQGFVNNGLATKGNSFGMKYPIWWNAYGADSLLFIDFVVNRNIVLWSGGDTDNRFGNVAASNLPGAVATGTPGYTFPATIMTEWAIVLHGEVVGPRSRTI